jgi:hypothetical protein
MMLGYVHQTKKIRRIWDFSSGSRGRAVECSNVISAEDQNAREKPTPDDPGISLEDWPEDFEANDDDDDDEDEWQRLRQTKAKKRERSLQNQRQTRTNR